MHVIVDLQCRSLHFLSMTKGGIQRNVVYVHGSIVVFGGLLEKSEKKKRDCILSQNLTQGLNAQHRKKGCIRRNRLKFAMAACCNSGKLVQFCNSFLLL